MPTDSSGHEYFDVEDIRVTVVSHTWDGAKGLRVQA